MRLLGPVAGAVAVYAGVNQWVFGHPTSISSWLKFGWPGTLATGWFGLTSPGFKLRMAVCSLAALAFFLVRWRRSARPAAVAEDLRSPGGEDRGVLAVELLGMLNLFTLVYFAVLLLFARSGIYGWYFALPMTTLSITVLWLIRGRCESPGGDADGGAGDHTADAAGSKPEPSPGMAPGGSFPNAGSRGPWSTAVQIALLAGRVAAAGADLVRRTRLPDPELPAMAALLRSDMPSDARILMVDVSGKMGYASGRAIVNGDGLINGWEYQDTLRTGRLGDYLRKHRIEWLLWQWFYDQEKPEILIPLWHGPRDYRFLTFTQPVKPVLRAGRFGVFRLATGTFAID